MDPDTIEAVVLDVNETLFGLDAVRERMATVNLDPDLLPLWFAEVLRDGFALAAAGRFAAFPDLARARLRAHLAAAGGDPDRASEVLGGFEAVTAHDDVRSGLPRLRSAGLRVGTMTNGTAAITAGFLEREGLADAVDEVMDVSEVGAWKPARPPYLYAAGRLGAALDATLMVAVHPWDVAGAVAAGLRGAWINRGGDEWPRVFPTPALTVGSFDELADRLR